jgi:hypothetical protein
MIMNNIKNKSPQTIAGCGFCRKFEITTNQITMTNLHNSEQEVWKSISNYEGFYEISNFGRVRSLERMVLCMQKGKPTYKPVPNRILKPTPDKDGYLLVFLKKNGRKAAKVHRLVAIAFIHNPQNKPEVNHKNFIKTDNTVDNLEWATPLENTGHNMKFGNRPKMPLGEKAPIAKLSNSQRLEIYNACKDGAVMRHLAFKYNVDPKTIKQIAMKDIEYFKKLAS